MHGLVDARDVSYVLGLVASLMSIVAVAGRRLIVLLRALKSCLCKIWNRRSLKTLRIPLCETGICLRLFIVMLSGMLLINRASRWPATIRLRRL